jgi:hypothetical protein
VLKLASKFVPAADGVHCIQNLKTGTDPECRMFQKFAALGHYRRPGATRQGTSCDSPSGVLLGSINSNDLKRSVALLEQSLAKWDTLKREERLLPTDLRKQLADIQRPERQYPEDSLALNVTSRDMPREKGKANPTREGWGNSPGTRTSRGSPKPRQGNSSPRRRRWGRSRQHTAIRRVSPAAIPSSGAASFLADTF